MTGISAKAIEERAYHIWMREGCPHGRDFEHWVQAQVELEAERERRTGNGAVAAPAPRRRAAAPAVKAKAKATAKPATPGAKRKPAPKR
jgi:hypothetical protein